MSIFSTAGADERKEIHWVGSLGFDNTLTVWFENFRKEKPNIVFSTGVSGARFAFPPIIEGYSHFGPMTRDPKPKEIEAYRDKYKRDPLIIKVGIYPLLIFAHQDNPVTKRGLTLDELSEIFSDSKTRINRWEKLGVKNINNINLYGRNPASGVNGYFKRMILKKNDFFRELKQRPGNMAVIKAVEEDPDGIGYGYNLPLNSKAKAIPIIVNGVKVLPTVESFFNKRYPLSKTLTILLQPQPIEEVKDFIKFCLRESSQKILIDDGFIPLPKSQIKLELEKLK